MIPDFVSLIPDFVSLIPVPNPNPNLGPGTLMAFASTTIWEIETGGSDTANGGGFDPNNANFATDLVATNGNTSSPSVSSASYTFLSRDVGAYLYVKSGTNWVPGWYKIASVSGGAATLSTAFYSSSNVPITAGTGNCSTVAAPTGGTWGIDYSIATAPSISYTDLVIDAATNTNFTSAANPIGKHLVGNVIAITGGTGFTVQRVQVVSVVGTTGTADKSLGTLASTGGTGGLGGALASLGQAQAAAVSGNSYFLNAGTYTMSSITQAVSGGSFSMQLGTSTVIPNYLVGYTTNRILNNGDARPVIKPSVNSFTMVYVGGGNSLVRNIEFTNPSANTGITALRLDNNATYADAIKVSNATVGVSVSSTKCTVTNALTTGCTTGFSGFQARFYGCVALGGVTGFSLSSSLSTLIWCVASDQSGTNAAGFAITNPGDEYNFINCIANNISGTNSVGFNAGGFVLDNSLWINCIAANCTRYGFSFSNNVTNRMVSCLGYNNTLGNYDTTVVPSLNSFFFIASASDPFVSSSTYDFRPSLLSPSRAAAWPPALQGLLSTNYLDVGAFQHQDTGNVTNNIIVKSLRRVI